MNDKVKIVAYKHDGSINLISNGSKVIENNSKHVILGSSKSELQEKNGNIYIIDIPCVIVFPYNAWHNIICQKKKSGYFYYCNISSPPKFSKKMINYIDYDLDLRIFPDMTFKVLDKNEYKYNRKKMNYSEKLDMLIKDELKYLTKNVEKIEYFNKKSIKDYFAKI